MSAIGRQSPNSRSHAVIEQEDDEAYFAPDKAGLGGDKLSGSLILAPSSISAHIGKTLKQVQTIHIDLDGRVVKISGVFGADARRADEPQTLSLNGVQQDRVETDRDLKILVARVDAATGTDRLEIATEIASQRPGILLRNAIVEEFEQRFHYVPIFDANSVMDSSVNLIGSRDLLQSESHLTGLIRFVLPRSDEDGLEPLRLDHPIVYDGIAEVDAIHNTIEYKIDFQVDAPKPLKKNKFCVIL